MFTPFSMNAARTRVRCVSVDKRDASQLTSIAKKWVHIISVQRPWSNSHSGRAPAQRSKLPREISAAPSMSFSIIVFPSLCSYLFCLPFYCFFFVNYNICEDNFGDTGQHWCKAQEELKKWLTDSVSRLITVVLWCRHLCRTAPEQTKKVCNNISKNI